MQSSQNILRDAMKPLIFILFTHVYFFQINEERHMPLLKKYDLILDRRTASQKNLDRLTAGVRLCSSPTSYRKFQILVIIIRHSREDERSE